MDLQRREALDELVMSMRAGRLKRRTFLERAFRLGLTATAAGSLLEACGTMQCSTQNGSTRPNIIIWQSEYDPQGVFGKWVKDFNDGPSEGGHVTYASGSPSSDKQYKWLSQNLSTCPSTASAAPVDVISMDIIWLTEFASKGLIIPLTAIQKEIQQRASAYVWVADECQYKGQWYGAPERADVGVFYYHKNLTPKPPDNWPALLTQASQVRGKNLDGFVWQGAQEEGLVCDFVEVLASYGGSILDQRNPQKVTLDNAQAIAALTTMMNWHAISPKDISTYDEEAAMVRWKNGLAVFMRNWYNAISQVKDDPSARFTPIPRGDMSTSSSCTGGWLLGVNAATQNPDLAQRLITYLLQQLAMNSDETNDVLSVLPNVAGDGDIGMIARNVVSRPRIPKYVSLSLLMQQSLFNALKSASQAAPSRYETIAKTALKGLQADLTHLLQT